jgi:hypothetical protein
MAVPPARVIQGLPKITWRGLFAKCEDASFSFSHTQVERGAYGIDGAWHDHARRDPIKFQCKLHFVNTLFGGGVVEFPDNYQKWWDALKDGSTGPLRHPILGTINARVEKGNVSLSAQTTAGVVLNVEFTETLVDVTKATKFAQPSVDIKALAAQVGQDAGAFSVAFPSGILDRSLEDAVESFLGDVHAAQLTATGYATQIVGKVERMIAAVERVTDPRVAPLYTNLVTLWDALRTRAKEAERVIGRSTSQRRAEGDTTLDALATGTGNTVEELMELNPALVQRTSVPKGTLYAYYTDK